MTARSVCSFFLLAFLFEPTVSVYSPLEIRSSGVPHYLVIDLDESTDLHPNLQDNDIKAVQMSVSFSGTPGGMVSYSFFKCGELLFNSTTSAASKFALKFREEWISLFLNGTTEECGAGKKRELVILVTSTVQVDGSFNFEKTLQEDINQNMMYLTSISVFFDGKIKRIDAPLEGILKIQEELSQYFPITISADNEMSFEIGVCNSTFLRIQETTAFSRAFTEKERKILSLMRNVRCNSWNVGLYKTDFFIKSLSGQGTLRIQASLGGTSNLLDNDAALSKIVKI